MFDLVRGMPFCLRDVAMDLSSFYTSVFSVWLNVPGALFLVFIVMFDGTYIWFPC